MSERRDKIIDVAIKLAEDGGFDNVRQRDVAEQAGVALGTLYKTFRSKEDILAAALERETARLEVRLEKRPVKGDNQTERVCAFFRLMTKGMVRKPNWARAVIRAMASGNPEIAGNVAAYYDRMTGLVIAAMRGVGTLSYGDAMADPPTEDESSLALMLQQYWFSCLVGWSAGLFGHAEINDQVDKTAKLLMLGSELSRKSKK